LSELALLAILVLAVLVVGLLTILVAAAVLLLLLLSTILLLLSTILLLSTVGRRKKKKNKDGLDKGVNGVDHIVSHSEVNCIYAIFASENALHTHSPGSGCCWTRTEPNGADIHANWGKGAELGTDEIGEAC